MKNLSRNRIYAIALFAVIAFSVCFSYGAGYYFASIGTDYDVHTWVRVERDGEIVFEEYNAGVLTTIGKNFIEGKLGDNAYGNNAKFADSISLSTNTGTPLAAWTQIPTEITTGGLDRNQGTYTSTGDGQWEIEYQFTATATHTDVQLTGCQWETTDASDNNLFFADTFTPVTLEADDKITVTCTITASGS